MRCSRVLLPERGAVWSKRRLLLTGLTFWIVSALASPVPANARSVNAGAAPASSMPHPPAAGIASSTSVCATQPKRVYPDYPVEAVEDGAHGRAVVRLQVGACGAVLSAELQRSAGHPALDHAVLDAARQWVVDRADYSDTDVPQYFLVDFVFVVPE